MSPESGSREPVTEALLDAWIVEGIWPPPSMEPPGGWTPPRLVAAIQAEAVFRFAEALRTAVEALPVVEYAANPMSFAYSDGLDRVAVLSEIERLSQAPADTGEGA